MIAADYMQGSGTRYLEIVIKFDTTASFEIDITVDQALQATARVSMVPGPIRVTNITEMGFKKLWWEFWKK